MSIAVAVSGGVDSLSALVRLKEQGEEVLALHGLFVPDANAETSPALAGLRANCTRLGIPLHVVDARIRFQQAVITPFLAAYLRGQTPNPCALCNAAIKFGVLADTALQLGADRLATGHYAALLDHPVYGRVLGRAADPVKDQSYFLALVPAARLALAQFPLADERKAQVREHLAQRGLEIPLPVESQEICFVPRDDYRAFLRASGSALPGPGPMRVLDNGAWREVGQHQGLWNHTEGQRRGLGVSWREPLYVIGKDAARNALLLGQLEDLQTTRCQAENLNILVPPALWPRTLFVRTRYRQEARPANVQLVDGPALDVCFQQPEARPAPGQVLAVYDEAGHVLAGGLVRAFQL